MMRNTFLVVAVVVALARPALAAPPPPTRPLAEILLDLDDAPLSVVKKVADLQAKEQFQVDKGPLYKSAPPMLNSDPKKLSDEVFFEGLVTPMSANSKLAIFSDDGCDVWIDGVLVLNNFAKGQHLPDLKQSLHVLEKFKPVPGRVYQIKIHHCNTIYNGKVDIDGCTLFAFEGGLQNANVEFRNTTRGGDRVVVAKSKEFDTPGGRKELKVIVPEGKKAKLTLKQTKDKTGTATFDEKDDAKTVLADVGNGKDITIFGRDVSRAARDISIQAEIDGKAAGSFEFTVFLVEMIPFIDGTSAERIPTDAKNEGGFGPDALRKIFDEAKEDKKLGVSLNKDRTEVQSGIVFRGKIIPEKLLKADFGTYDDTRKELGREAGFTEARRISTRVYINELLAPPFKNIRPGFYDEDVFDGPLPFSEDYIPDNDIKTKDNKVDPNLYVHGLDTPSLAIEDFKKLKLKEKDIVRERFNGVQHWEYAQVKCSRKAIWFFAASLTVDKESKWQLLNDIQNPKDDNMIGLKNIELTPNLQKAKGDPPKVSSFAPKELKGREVKFEIKGENFGGSKAPLRISLRKEIIQRNDFTNDFLVLDTFNVSNDGKTITGSIAIPGDQTTGLYTLQIFKDDLAAAQLPDATNIRR